VAIGLVYEWLVAAAKGLTTMERRAIRRALVSDLARAAEQAASLGRQFDDMVEATELTNTDDEHDPEGATIAFERAQAYSMLEQAVRDRTALQDALARIDEDSDFGLCQRCASPIGLERLLALPATLLCVECAR